MEKGLIFLLGIVYFVIINLFTFGLFGLDKAKARKKKWRIPERGLLYVCALGGGLGGFLGMRFFRHKTKKTKFKILVPLFLILWLGIIIGALIFLDITAEDLIVLFE